jgi:hypothetical protein
MVRRPRPDDCDVGRLSPGAGRRKTCARSRICICRVARHVPAPSSLASPGAWAQGCNVATESPAQRPLDNESRCTPQKAGHAPSAGRIARDPRRQGGQGGQLIRRVRRARTTRNSCGPNAGSDIGGAASIAERYRAEDLPSAASIDKPATDPIGGAFCASMRGGRFARLGVNVGITHGVRYVRCVPS